MRALVYGAMNPDLVHELERLPEPGDDVRSEAWSLTWGGKAANAAAALAAWGVETTLLGVVIGTDPLGDALLATLDRPHLDTTRIERDPETRTGHCVILVTPGGDRTIVCAGYEHSRWQSVPADAWDDADVVLLDGFAADAGARVAAEAGRRAVPCVWLDAPNPPPVPVDLVVWSRHEHDPSEAGELASSGHSVVLTAGAEPVAAWWGGRFDMQPPPVTVGDSTGAGDVFAAACAYGIASGWRPREVIRWATAAGSAAAAGSDRIPDRAAVEAALRTIDAG